MIMLTRRQFSRICPKKSALGQCDWFRETYGTTLEIKGDYYLSFKTPEEETFFMLQYADEINRPFDALEDLADLIVDHWHDNGWPNGD